jgi:hypothetical protein
MRTFVRNNDIEIHAKVILEFTQKLYWANESVLFQVGRTANQTIIICNGRRACAGAKGCREIHYGTQIVKKLHLHR